MTNLDEYIQREHDVLKRFSDSKLAEIFEIHSNVRWRSSHKYVEFDIALFKKDIIYAVIEIKHKLSNQAMENAKRQIENALHLANCRFGIITDNKVFYLIDSAHLDRQYIKMDFVQIVDCLIKPNVISQNRDGKERIKTALELFFKQQDIILSICDNLNFDESQGFFSFSTIENEKSFFLLLMGELEMDKAVYRYTSLDTLFVMLNKGTYRLNGIVGMNDKSEIDYFDKECPIDNSGSSVRQLNETYLSSCSSLKDDLTMWRLYGDDAKGVCLEFEMTPQEKRYNNFILAPVNYAKRRGEHTALKMIKALSEANVRFAELSKWKHFFKPYDYSVEKEIRLMFLDNGRYDNGVTNRDWVKTWSHSIINPIVDFKLNASGFPLQLRKVIIGPKMPELDINKSQLEDLISAKGYYIKVENSEIDNYR
jgi:hypothetical protein